MLHSEVWGIYFWYPVNKLSDNKVLEEPYMWDSWNHPNLKQRLDPSFCFLSVCFVLKQLTKFLGPVNMQFCSWIRERCFCSCGLERLPGCFHSVWSTKFWRSEKSWHIIGKLISFLLHSVFRGAWCRQSSKWWSWCSAAEHLGFPTGVIGMKWVISHNIFWKSQKRKFRVKLNTVCNLLLSLIWGNDVLHQACSQKKLTIGWFLC